MRGFTVVAEFRNGTLVVPVMTYGGYSSVRQAWGRTNQAMTAIVVRVPGRPPTFAVVWGPYSDMQKTSFADEDAAIMAARMIR